MNRTIVERWKPAGLAFSTLACPAWSLERVAEAAQPYGYGGIELRLLDGETIESDLGPEERRRVRSVLAGLPIVAVDTSIRLAGAEPRSTAAQIVSFLQLAAEWGSPLIRVFGGERPPDRSGDQVLDDMARLLAEVAPDAEQLGVGIALETHDTFSSAQEVARLLARVESPAVGGLWDILHTYRVGEAPAVVTRSLGERLLHVHVKDGRRPADGAGAAWDLVLLGEGDVPTAETLGALREHGYLGWLCVEWEKKWHPEIAEPEVALPQHAAALGRLLAEMGATA